MRLKVNFWQQLTTKSHHKVHLAQSEFAQLWGNSTQRGTIVVFCVCHLHFFVCPPPKRSTPFLTWSLASFCPRRVSSRVTRRRRPSVRCSSVAKTSSSTPPGWNVTQTTSISIYCSVKLPPSEPPPTHPPPPPPPPPAPSPPLLPPARTSQHHSCLGPPLTTDQSGRPERTYSRLHFSKETVWNKKAKPRI